MHGDYKVRLQIKGENTQTQNKYIKWKRANERKTFGGLNLFPLDVFTDFHFWYGISKMRNVKRKSKPEFSYISRTKFENVRILRVA